MSAGCFIRSEMLVKEPKSGQRSPPIPTLEATVKYLQSVRKANHEFQIAQEHEHFDDILQADFVDHYNNLTLKSIYTLKYLVMNDWKVSCCGLRKVFELQ